MTYKGEINNSSIGITDIFLQGEISEVEKCAQYWPIAPGTSKMFDHIEVKNLSEAEVPHLTSTVVRSFEFKGTISMIHFGLRQRIVCYYNNTKVFSN